MAKPLLLFMVRKSGPFIPAIPAAVIQVFKYLETRMAGHLVALAASFMQSKPPAFAMLEVIADLHGDRGTDAGEAVDHHPD
jgi:hypothetical protein